MQVSSTGSTTRWKFDAHPTFWEHGRSFRVPDLRKRPRSRPTSAREGQAGVQSTSDGRVLLALVKVNPDGALVDDVVVGDFRRPWNARPEATRLAENISPATLWALALGGFGTGGVRLHRAGFLVRFRRRDFRDGPRLPARPRLGRSTTTFAR
jgi:hypothetical protein